ncbi:neurocalcin homolog [Diadema antillarum]|uniref:neurocalcin homolog n=1 Tax=Diadema antillarum TaxID=105358 RepID=UPI003A885442
MGNKGGKELKPETISDLKKQTAFTEEELQQWYADFRHDCPKGNLTTEDFAVVYRRYFPSGDPTKFTDHVFRTFDTNRDGTISFREFMCGISVLARGSLDDKLRWIFQIYDLDGNGFISKLEMLEILQGMYKMMGEMCDSLPYDEATPQSKTEKIFRQVDRNFDGLLSLDEFLYAAKHDSAITTVLQ